MGQLQRWEEIHLVFDERGENATLPEPKVLNAVMMCLVIQFQVRCAAWWHPVWRDEVWISGDNISPITRPFVALSGATDSQTGAGGEISFQFLSVTCILGSHQNNEAEERWDMIPFDYLMIIISKRLSSNITASFIIPPGSSDFFMDVGTRSFVWTSGSGRCLSH